MKDRERQTGCMPRSVKAPLVPNQGPVGHYGAGELLRPPRPVRAHVRMTACCVLPRGARPVPGVSERRAICPRRTSTTAKRRRHGRRRADHRLSRVSWTPVLPPPRAASRGARRGIPLDGAGLHDVTVREALELGFGETQARVLDKRNGVEQDTVLDRSPACGHGAEAWTNSR
jgi:hypothetical protein